MGWRPLRPGIQRGTEQPTVSIQKSGAVTWNQSAHEALGRPAQVEIMLDADRGRLGLRRAQDADESFRVRKLGPQNTWIASARGALRRAGLLPPSAYRQVAELEDGLLQIDVSELMRHGQPHEDQGQGGKK